MIKVLFVCQGNICRSPMAELIMKEYIRQKGTSEYFVINSKAISNEEVGHDIYPPAVEKLLEKKVPVTTHHAKMVTRMDKDLYDYIIGMDQQNIIDLSEILGATNKVYKLLYFVGNSYDISDPWYTHDFEKAYNEIYEGVVAFYNFLEKNSKIY